MQEKTKKYKKLQKWRKNYQKLPIMSFFIIFHNFWYFFVIFGKGRVKKKTVKLGKNSPGTWEPLTDFFNMLKLLKNA